ncbi:hypothetical protein FRC17_000518 [Serendipita sp. 399]|nr:hypothetical protein FRC17_000518 [Serendipita sp. 399]
MALVPIVNTGTYNIRNVAFGPIRDDEGALGAKGTSNDKELVWKVNRNSDGTYSLLASNVSANPGSALSEIEKRYYISVDNSERSASDTDTKWRLQPILSGSDPRILYVIYQLPHDNPHCHAVGHWELNKKDKKEPVKLNRFHEDEENKKTPTNYKPNALWTFEPLPEPTRGDPPIDY